VFEGGFWQVHSPALPLSRRVCRLVDRVHGKLVVLENMRRKTRVIQDILQRRFQIVHTELGLREIPFDQGVREKG
jgi:hypothetical protein